MATATSPALAAAQLVAPPCAEQGVAQVLRHWLARG